MATASIIRKKRKGDPDPILKVTLGKPKRTYTPGDYNPPGNPVVDRKTTPELGKQLGEPAAKTQARMAAQASGSRSYDYKGKKEYAGRVDSSRDVKLSTGKIPVKMDIKPVTMPKSTSPASTSTTMKKQPPVKKKFKASMKRRLPRVDYLQGKGHGRNKRTESGHGR